MNTQERPILKLRKRPIDQILTLLSYIAMVLIIALPIYYYSMLPDRIAIHFDLSGKANGFGSKNSIWLTPILGFMLFILMSWLSKRPHLFNYPVKINEFNAAEMYRLGRTTMLLTSVIVLSLLTYLSYMMCNHAINNKDELSPLIAGVFVAGLFLVMLNYFFKTHKIKNK